MSTGQQWASAIGLIIILMLMSIPSIWVSQLATEVSLGKIIILFLINSLVVSAVSVLNLRRKIETGSDVN